MTGLYWYVPVSNLSDFVDKDLAFFEVRILGFTPPYCLYQSVAVGLPCDRSWRFFASVYFNLPPRLLGIGSRFCLA